jgi:hypothetical protein
MTNIYMIEDDEKKAYFLARIIRELNQCFESPEFTDGFQGDYRNAQFDAQRLLNAVRDSDGICLIDMRLPEEAHDTTFKEIFCILKKENIDNYKAITRLYQQILETVGKKQYFQLACLLIAICIHENTSLMTISMVVTELGNPGIEILNKFRSKIEAVNFPTDKNTDEASLSILIDRITEKIKEIHAKKHNLFKSFLLKAELFSHNRIDSGDADNDFEQFLGLNSSDFEDSFCLRGTSHNSRLIPQVKDAIKTISGLTEDGKYCGRELCLNGAWLLALGKFCELSSKNRWTQRWQDIFDINELVNSSNNFYIAIHSTQRNKEARRNIILKFEKVCSLIFQHRDNKSLVLEKVTLTNNLLSFSLNFPLGDLSNPSSLYSRITEETASRDNQTSLGHDTSSAIYDCWQACSLSDRREYSVLETLSSMNVTEENGKTKISWTMSAN